MLKIFASLVSLSFAFAAHAATLNVGHECSDRATVPSLVCGQRAPGVPSDLDHQIYITEFQSCEQGRISDFHRSVAVTKTVPSAHGRQAFSFDASDVQLVMSDTRVRLETLSNDVTLVLPHSARVQDGRRSLQVQFDNQLSPSATALTGLGLKARFTEFDADNRPLASGEFPCVVIAN